MSRRQPVTLNFKIVAFAPNCQVDYSKDRMAIVPLQMVDRPLSLGCGSSTSEAKRHVSTMRIFGGIIFFAATLASSLIQ